MSKNTTQSFEAVVSDILNNEDFNKLNNELHHGITRYEHVVRVAKTTYRVGKLFHLKNNNQTTRAALLHDFYTDDEMKDASKTAKLTIHPQLAYNNAIKYYNLNNIQENIIKSHMFPLKGDKPKYKEAWLVSGVDKIVALYEMYRYKASLLINIWALFLFNIIIYK